MAFAFQTATARRLFVRRCAVAVLLGTYVLTAAGVPLPTGRQSYKGGEAFPCEKSSCGCHTVDQCWRSCCCHSFAERIAWARSHGVRPPDFAIAQAKTTGMDLSWLEKPRDTNLLCNSRSCCAKKQAATTPSCCEKRVEIATTKAGGCCSPPDETTPATSTDSRIVAWQALKCDGHSQNWLAAVPVLIRAEIALPQAPQLIARLGAPTSDVAEPMTSAPAIPPPEEA